MRIDEIRRAKRISQAQIAKKLGVSLSTYIRWEQHPEKIPIGMGVKIAELLETTYDVLIFLPEKVTKA